MYIYVCVYVCIYIQYVYIHVPTIATVIKYDYVQRVVSLYASAFLGHILEGIQPRKVHY
jgi:hypothetical protein